MKKAIVIGAGIAGIAASIRLAKKGYQVSVYETNSYPGGKLSTFSLAAYRFDAGPSLFTMPQYVDELFTLCGEEPKLFFQYHKKEIACEYFWEDGTQLTAFSEPEKYFREVEEKLGISSKGLKTYLDRAKKKYDLTVALFLEKSLHRIATYLTKDTLKALANLSLYEINQSLNQINVEQLQEPHLIQMYNRYATYNGSSPYRTPGIMTLVQHLESHYGTYIPKGGMGQITEALFQLAKRQGVHFYFNQKVEEIGFDDDQVTHVVIQAKKLSADVIVSNMDIYPTYRVLMPKARAPEKILSQERSSSAVIFYWGMNKQFPELDLHNILFSKDYKAEFDSIFNSHHIYEDPTIYINISSKDVPEDAPKGGENWFVMINTSADKGQNWDRLVTELRKSVIAKIERVLKTSVAEAILVEQILTPKGIEQNTQSFQGALYGASSNNKMAAFWRHPNFSRQFKNLYFCGGSVHPGGGIPLCLLSAKIMSEQVD